jgi:hypothetical protein
MVSNTLFNRGPVDGFGRKAVKNSVRELLDCTLYTRRCIDTVDSPGDEHEVSRNM